MGGLFEDRDQIAHGGDFLVVDQDIALFELGGHSLLVGDEVGREIPAVELHTLDHIEVGVGALGLFDGDDAVLADLFHSFGDSLADVRVVVGRDGADLGDFLALLDFLAGLANLVHNDCNGFVDAAFEVHGIGTGGYVFEALAEDDLGKDRGGGGAVASDIAGLGSDFLDHLRPHVLIGVFELDFLGDGDAVFGDGRRPELLVQHDVAAFWPQRHLDGIGQLIDASLERVARRHIKF